MPYISGFGIVRALERLLHQTEGNLNFVKLILAFSADKYVLLKPECLGFRQSVEAVLLQSVFSGVTQPRGVTIRQSASSD
jgi:hypothetical protein